MKLKIFMMLAIGIVMGLFFGQVSMGAEGRVHSLVMIVDYEISPDRAGDFDSAVQEVNSQLEKYNFPFSFEVFKTENSHAFMVYKLENFADTDRMNQFWDELQQKMGDQEFKALWEKLDVHFRIVGSSFWDRRPDISTLSSQSLSTGAEKPKSGYASLSFYHIKHGQEMEAINIFKQSADIYKAKNVSTGFDIYESRFGPERLLYVQVFNASSPEELLLQNQKNMEKIGKECRGQLEEGNNRLKSIISESSIIRGSWQPHLAFKKKK